MKHTNRFLTALALGGAVLGAGADSGPAKAGTFQAAAGTVQVQRSGQAVTAAAGSEVDAGDLIKVGSGSSAQVRMTDNAVFELGSDTNFQVTSYNYAGSGVVSESRAPATARYRIDGGVLRTVTGAIGKQRGDDYMVTAPEADIRVHGTDYSAQDTSGLLVIVYAGSVTVSNDTGSIELSSGQYVYVGSRHHPLHWKSVEEIKTETVIPTIIRLPPISIPIPVSPS